MQKGGVRGLGSSEQAEVVFLSGYNNSGAQMRRYAPVFWDVAAADCKSFCTCNTGAGTAGGNHMLFAGVLQDTVGTKGYTPSILAYGPTYIRGYGDTGWIPNVPLYVPSAADYAVSVPGAKLPSSNPAPWVCLPPIVALGSLAFSDTAGQTALANSRVFIRAL